MDKRYLKPAPGLQVRDDVTKQPLPEDGAEVVMSTYWHRRLRDGDVVLASPPKTVRKAADAAE